MNTTITNTAELQRLRLPELLEHAAKGETERRDVALELLRRDENRGKGLAPDTSDEDRLRLALSRLERRVGKAPERTDSGVERLPRPATLSRVGLARLRRFDECSSSTSIDKARRNLRQPQPHK